MGFSRVYFTICLQGGSASFLPKVDCFVDGTGRKQEGVLRESIETYSMLCQECWGEKGSGNISFTLYTLQEVLVLHSIFEWVSQVYNLQRWEPRPQTSFFWCRVGGQCQGCLGREAVQVEETLPFYMQFVLHDVWGEGVRETISSGPVHIIVVAVSGIFKPSIFHTSRLLHPK